MANELDFRLLFEESPEVLLVLLPDAAAHPERAVEVHIGALPDVNADPTLLRQVFANLVGNAFKFTRDRERASVEISGELQGGECVYCIRDNGAGFDMRHADRLFRIFQRLQGAEELED